MTVNTVVTPSMTSSNSMSSGYCSLDDESEDFTFFTAKTSFFRKPKQAPKVQKPEGSRPAGERGVVRKSSDATGVSCRQKKKPLHPNRAV